MEDDEMSTYEVIVGNIGTTYSGPSAMVADAEFKYYKAASINGEGRASGESVVMMKNGEIVLEHEPQTIRRGRPWTCPPYDLIDPNHPSQRRND